MLQSRRQRKVDGTELGVILFRLTENCILMNSENFFFTEYDLEIQNFERRNSECALIESRREFESQVYNYWKPINGQIKLSVTEYTCVVNWR